MFALLCLQLSLVWPPLDAAAAPDAALDILKAEDFREPDSAVLKAALAAPSAEVRARAARAMGRTQDASYLSPLLESLRDPDDRMRAEAAFAVGQVRLADAAAPPDAVTETLAGLVSDSAKAVRLAALEALGKSGGPMTEAFLAGRLGAPEPESRREAAFALARLHRQGRIAAYSPGTTRALVEGLSGPPSSRWACAYALARRPELSIARALDEASRDPDPWTRLFSLRALARLGREAPCEAGRRALRDEDERVRVEAVVLLGACGGGDRLGPAADDPSAHVRAAAAAALSGPNGDLAALRRLAQDPSPLVRSEALAGVFEKTGRDSGPELQKALSDPSWWVRSRVAFTAGLRTGNSELLSISLQDEDPRVRAAALDGLVEGGSSQAPKLVAAALEDPDSPLEYRGTAVRAAGRLRSAELIVPLMSGYMNSFKHDQGGVREAAVEATAAMLEAHPRSKELLSLRDIILKDPAPYVRAKAARLFAKEGPARSSYEPSPFLGVETSSATRVVLLTNKGKIVLALETERAPVHAANVVSLVRRGFYDGRQWHRVVPNQLVQGGDPRGSGWGDAGYFLRDEISPSRFERGTVGMPRAAKDTGSCQLFIATVPSPQLDGEYTAFGRVVAGMEVVDLLEPGDFISKAYLPE